METAPPLPRAGREEGAVGSQEDMSDNLLTPRSYDSALDHALANMELADDPKRCFVFLGGACNPTTWREKQAVPKLNTAGIPLYNPQMTDWFPELIDRERVAKQDCTVLLFVIDARSRGISSMLEVTEFIMRKREVVLVIEPMPEGTRIDGELVQGQQLDDLNRARAYLCDIASRQRKHCKVYPTVKKGVAHVISEWGKYKEKEYKRRRKLARIRHKINASSATGQLPKPNNNNASPR